MKGSRVRLIITIAAITALTGAVVRTGAQQQPPGAGPAAGKPHAQITVDYPLEGSVFPPDMAAPTFLWHNPADAADSWHIEVTFGDGAPAIHEHASGGRRGVGEIDPRCVSPTNKLPDATSAPAMARS